MEPIEAFDILYRSVRRGAEDLRVARLSAPEKRPTKHLLALIVALLEMADLSGCRPLEEQIPDARKLELAHVRTLHRLYGAA